MLGLPWWAWLIIGLLAAFVLLFWVTWKGFRRGVRRGFIQYLKDRDDGIEILEERETYIVLRTEKSDHAQIFLAKLYGGIAQARADTPEARREVFRQFYESLAEHEDTAMGPLTLEEHGDRIRPRLVRPEALEALRRQSPVPYLELAELGLVVVYVLDAENSVMYLTSAHVNDMGLGLEALHERALNNLGANFPRKVIRGIIAECQLAMIKSGDTYDAARLLLVPGLLREGEELAAAIPDRDTLALLPVPDDENWAPLRHLAHSPGSEHLLLDRPVRVTPLGFTLV